MAKAGAVEVMINEKRRVRRIIFLIKITAVLFRPGLIFQSCYLTKIIAVLFKRHKLFLGLHNIQFKNLTQKKGYNILVFCARSLLL